MHPMFSNNNTNALLEPFMQWNQTVCKNLEQVAKVQMESFQYFSELALSQTKKASQIENFEQLMNYMKQQSEITGNVSQHLAEDAKKIFSITQKIGEDINHAAQESGRAIVESTTHAL